MDIHRIKSLHHENFAGSEAEDITFNEGLTQILGANGVGKSRYEKALKWLLFGKNAQDESKFSIKNTKDTSKNRLDTIVSCIWNKNGSDIEIKRVYRENWQKKQGTNDYFYKGNTTEYFFDSKSDIGMNAFNQKIKELVAIDVFKAVTSVTYFANLGWEEQRKMLFKLIPEASDENIAAGNKDFEELLASLKNGKTLSEYHKDIKKGIADLADRIKLIPPVIKELTNGMPSDEGFDEIEAEMEKLKAELKEVEETINSELQQQNVKNQARTKVQGEINSLRAEKQQLEFSIKQEYNSGDQNLAQIKRECREKIDNEERSLSSAQNKLKLLEAELAAANSKLEDINKEWDEVSASKYEPTSDGACVKCGYDAGAADREAAFTKKKNEQLASINTRGPLISTAVKEAKVQIEEVKLAIKVSEDKLIALRAEFLELNKENTEARESLESVTSRNPRIIELVLAISEKEESLGEEDKIDQSELKLKKDHINEGIAFLIGKLGKKEEREKDLQRIEELKKQESALGQEQAEKEKIDFIIKKFESARVDAAEGPLNSKFKFVTFKLFNTAVDGSVSPTCVPLVDFVPWKDANTSGQIIAGLDIIDALSEIYQVSAPIWVDNVESVTSKLVCNSQLITMEAIEGLPLTIN